MQNGPVASVNSIQSSAFQPPFLHSSKPDYQPPPNGPTQSPSLKHNNEHHYQQTHHSVPSINRSSITPPFSQMNTLQTSSLPPSLSSSPKRNTLESAQSTSHLSGPPASLPFKLQPNPITLSKVPPPSFQNQGLPSGILPPDSSMMQTFPKSTVQSTSTSFQSGQPMMQINQTMMQSRQTMMQPPQLSMQSSSIQQGPPRMMPPRPPLLRQPISSSIHPGHLSMQSPITQPQPGPQKMIQSCPLGIQSGSSVNHSGTMLQTFETAAQPPLCSSSASNISSRLGPAGLKGKRPVPVYNFNTPPAVANSQIPFNPGQQTMLGQSLPSNRPTSEIPLNQPTQQHQGGMQPPPIQDPVSVADRMRKMSISDLSYINLMEHRSIFPATEKLSCLPPLQPDLLTKNKHPEHFCSTTNVVPATSGLLGKLKIPFGLVIQPFKDLGIEVPVINPPIPRCKVCRTYVNPYVQLSDGGRRWKCNICSRLNDMPADYFYGEDGRRVPFDISNRAELNSALVEYIAPSEYTTRPPQAALYLYLIDVSVGAVQSGMVKMACKVLEEELDAIPGDSRTSIGIICFDSKLYYFNLHKNSGQPQMLVVPDVEEAFIPTIDDLLVNLKEHKAKIKGLLSMIPSIFEDTKDSDVAVGPILNAAKLLIFGTGGRISLLLSRAPSMGIGTTKKRSETSKLESLTLSPVDDFYKGLALDCTQKQVSVDMFLFPNSNIDLPTISACSQYSSGTVFYYPQYHFEKNPLMAEKFLNEFRHYIIRPIAFEAVLRIRCTSGINIHSFFGNCFVRAHDLIALANVSPDVAFGVQTNIDDTLHENKLAIFQSALLYTSSKGDRRIRVHTLALPISSDPQTIYNNLNIDACITLLSKLAVDKANSSSLGDAREALQYAVIDPLTKYRSDFCPNTKGSGQLVVSKCHRLLPLYISSLLKSKAFRLQNVSVDERFHSMLQFKTLPVDEIMLMIYPRLFSLHNLTEVWTDKNSIPPRISLTAEKLTRQGAFLIQTPEFFIIWIGRHISDIWVNAVYNKNSFSELTEISVKLEHFDNAISDLIHDLISLLSKIREIPITVVSVREDSRFGHMFLQHLIEDRSDGQISYYEFLQKIQQQIG